MGIKDLLKEIRKRHPGVVMDDVCLGAFKGHRLAIDIGIYSYKYMAVANKEAIKYINVMQDDPKRSVLRSYFLEKYYQFMMMFIESGITPIAVFDGPAFRLKKKTAEKRSQDKADRVRRIQYLRNQLRETEDVRLLNELKACMEANVTYDREDWVMLESMLRTMGIPVIKAPYEAEAVCARLARKGYVSGVVSNDGDTLAHLAKIMIIDVKREYRRDLPNHKCTCIILNNVLTALQMQPKQFVDFCIMCGNDYIDRIPLIGFVKSLELILNYGSIEAAIPNIKKDISSTDMVNKEILNEVRGYFLGELEIDVDCIPVVMYENGLQEFLGEIITGFNRARVLGDIDKVTKMLREFNQSFAALQQYTIQLQ